MKKKALIILFILLGVLLIGGLLYFLVTKPNLNISVGGKEVKLAIPHFASYKCDVIDQKFGVTTTIPKNGFLLSKNTAGFYTNGVEDLEVNIDLNFFGSLVTDSRIRYQICDENGNNCGSDITKFYAYGGKKTLELNSLDFSRESMRIYFEYYGGVFTGFKWKSDNSGSASVSYDANVFGLTLSSTTQDPAGKVICSTSCDLSCPDIGYRQDLVVTDEDVLGFYQTAPYLEYWESINYDLNEQGGATIYNSATNTFCFAGTIYTGKTLELGSGKYIYPDKNTRENLQCCPGARISSTNSDKVCQSDGTWKVIQDTDKLTCISEINCPGAGNEICQNRKLSQGYSCINKDINNIGICQKSSEASVECCVSSDCNRDQVCDTITHTCKGGVSTPVCGNSLVEAGEECDDGNTKGGDGCNSICQVEQGTENCKNNLDDDGDGLIDSADPDCQNDLKCNPIFQTLKQKESCRGNPLCWFGITKPKTIQKCALSTWVYLVSLAILLGLVVGIMILKSRIKYSKRR